MNGHVCNCVLHVVANVHMPKDRITTSHQGYGFVEFMGEEDADYAIKIMNMIKLYGKPIRVNKVCCNTVLTLIYIVLNYIFVCTYVFIYIIH